MIALGCLLHFYEDHGRDLLWIEDADLRVSSNLVLGCVTAQGSVSVKTMYEGVVRLL